MGQKFLLDSNTIIEYFAEALPQKAIEAISTIINETFIISIIVKIEVLGFDGKPGEMKQLEKFLELAEILPLTEDIADKTIELRKKYKKLGLGDAIIAATANIHNLTIITRNISDFNKIQKLKIINPHDLIN